MEIMDAQWLEKQLKAHPDKTKAALARAIGLEPPAISKILNGTRQIKAREYDKMRQFFGLPSDGKRSLEQNSAYVLETLSSTSALHDDGDEQKADWAIPADILKTRTPASADQIKIFKVSDNLMEPAFKRDGHVLVDLSDQKPSPPGAFIVSDGFGYMVRNCQFIAQSDPPTIEVISTGQSNPQSGAFEIIGRVIAKLEWV